MDGWDHVMWHGTRIHVFRIVYIYAVGGRFCTYLDGAASWKMVAAHSRADIWDDLNIDASDRYLVCKVGWHIGWVFQLLFGKLVFSCEIEMDVYHLNCSNIIIAPIKPQIFSRKMSYILKYGHLTWNHIFIHLN